MALSLRIPNLLRALLCALLFAVPTFVGNGGALNAAVADEVNNAIDTVDTNLASGDAKMAPMMDETGKTVKWVIYLLWLAIPLILFGSLIAYGVWQAKQNETQAAYKTFAAVAIGVIAYFGVLTIFFT